MPGSGREDGSHRNPLICSWHWNSDRSVWSSYLDNRTSQSAKVSRQCSELSKSPLPDIAHRGLAQCSLRADIDDSHFAMLNCRAPGSLAGQHSMERAVATGTVKWFNPTKGYGFIQPQSGGKDVFVHISAVERAGLSTLNEGAQVSFDVVANRGKESAENLKVK